MPRRPNRNVADAFGRLIKNTVRLVNRIFNQSKVKPEQPKPPKQATRRSSRSDYEKRIKELERQVQEQQKQIELLEAQRRIEERNAQVDAFLREHGMEDLPLWQAVKKLNYDIDTLQPLPEPEPEPEPAAVDEPTPPEVPQFSEDDLPYEIIDDTTDADTTYKNFGSIESLVTIINFLQNEDISGVPADSPFFDLSPMEQKYLLLDYIEYQHDANPALFYKGRKALELENVPIWGAEFERFVEQNALFEGTTSGDGTFNTSGIDTWLDEVIEEY